MPTAVADADTEGAAGATLCVTAFIDQNANGFRDAGERLLPGVLITVFDGQQAMGAYTTDGTSEPYCFGGLPEGNYRVAQQVADNWTATTLAAWGVSLKAGDLFNAEFGNVAAQPGGTGSFENDVAAAAPDEAAVGGKETIWTRACAAICTGAGIFGILLVMGAVAFLMVARRMV